MNVVINVPDDSRIMTIVLTEVPQDLKSIRTTSYTINPNEVSCLEMGYEVETKKTPRQ